MKHASKIALFLVAIIWGTGFVASSLALETLTPNEILVIRFSLAFVVLLVMNGSRLKQIKKSDMLKGSLVGLFLYLGFYFQTVGLQYTTPSKNAFLTAVNIVIVPFFALIVLREKLSYKSFVGAGVTLLGIGFISLESGFQQMNRGDLLTLVCAFFFALQIFSTDVFAKEIKTWSLMLAQMGTASLLAWLSFFFSRDSFALFGQVDFTVTSLYPVLYLGLISTLLAYFLQTWAQKKTTSTETAVILSTEAFFGMLASVLILNEQITSTLLIGALLIFAGIIIVEVDFLEFKRVWRIMNEEKKSNH
ncbi:MAG: DMT family transporter [Enterococcus lemanii]|jgi:drug/metabolite transporter (DMT)-like permease